MNTVYFVMYGEIFKNLRMNVSTYSLNVEHMALNL